MKFPSVRDLVSDTLFHNTDLKVDLQGWHSTDPVFKAMIEQVKPEVIIEVGTWRGASALHMAGLAPEAQVYCVDTWLGGADHWLHEDKENNNLVRDAFGMPRLYHQFLFNAASSIFSNRIHPVQQTSANGARLLAHAGIKAQLIYVDGSHEYEDVYTDLGMYSELLDTNGVMFGDDFRDFPGVRLAVTRFAFERQIPLKTAGDFWILAA